MTDHDAQLAHRQQPLQPAFIPATCSWSSRLRARASRRSSTRCSRSDQAIRLSISYTTRPPRPKDQDGVHYHFVTVDEFLERHAKRRISRKRGSARQLLRDFARVDRGADEKRP